MDEILVTNGAYYALYSICQSLINPGDEVIIIEPFFDCYAPMVRLAGGIPVYFQLEISTQAAWKVNFEKLFEIGRNLKNLKAIILNNPNNPLGKVFTRI